MNRRDLFKYLAVLPFLGLLSKVSKTETLKSKHFDTVICDDLIYFRYHSDRIDKINLSGDVIEKNVLVKNYRYGVDKALDDYEKTISVGYEKDELGNGKVTSIEDVPNKNKRIYSEDTVNKVVSDFMSIPKPTKYELTGIHIVDNPDYKMKIIKG